MPTLEPPPWEGAQGSFVATNNNITGGFGGLTVTVYDAYDLVAWAVVEGAVTIQVAGEIKLDSATVVVASDKTLLGVGLDADIQEGCLEIRAARNVIIQNIKFRAMTDDAITVSQASSYVWIDHCTFTDSEDGLVDIIDASTMVTISWCTFHDHNKVSLVGKSKVKTQDTAIKVTYHHNWFSDVVQRSPRLRFGQAHVYNNFFEYMRTALVANMRGQILSEHNYFRRVEEPMSTFPTPNEDPEPGFLVSKGDIFVHSGAPNIQGPLPTFDPRDYYDYALDDAERVPGLVMQFAGRGRKWTLRYDPFDPTAKPTPRPSYAPSLPLPTYAPTPR